MVARAHIYRAFGIVIESELPLLLSAHRPSGDVDLRITLGEVSPTDDWAYELPDVCRFRCADGSSVVVEPTGQWTPEQLGVLAGGPVLSVLLRRRGLLALHASTVEVDGFAVAIVGESGSGKSTLVAAVAGRGVPVVGDDLTVVEPGERPMVVPGGAGIKLWPEAAARIGFDVEGLRPVFAGSPKLAFEPVSVADRSLPLGVVYELVWGDSLEIHDLGAVDAFVALKTHTRESQLLSGDDGAASRHLAVCGAVVAGAAVRRLERPRDLALLDEVVDVVLADSARRV